MLIAGFPAGSFQANCYVLATGAGAECIVVDPGEGAVAGLRQLFAEHRLTPVAAMATHGHLDHTAGLGELCREYDIPAYVHPGDQYMLDDPRAALSPELNAALDGIEMDGVRPDRVLPLSDGLRPGLAGLPLTVDHVPGHTPGSVVYRLDRDGDRPEIVLTGDTLFAGSIGRTDLTGGNLAQELTSIRDRILSRPDDTVVLAGHGPTTTVGEQKRSNPFLTEQALARALAGED
ncbi:MBL fold metallo-hydrolase [Nakamurella sp.]|uniref:MBL fold metallo-hydrolase n=1 Tax=Nakamurella sp. TaxID=1869182 RepID=UPI003B3B88FC